MIDDYAGWFFLLAMLGGAWILFSGNGSSDE